MSPPSSSLAKKNDACCLYRKEVERLHEFFVGWFSGQLDKQPSLLQADCHDRFSDDFSMVVPSGNVVTKAQLVDRLNLDSHGCHGPSFRINIPDFELLQQYSETLTLVRYVEVQHRGGDDQETKTVNARISTAVLEQADNVVLWRHVHETSLPNEG